ncbi:AraC family transcriptional regulator [Pseudomonas sp. M47T1]|uniref:GlxA family transcriptional regulator n=1 Tax=Pseudomonas sp. M47T1 TaxID=1179778 RepID=UPI0002608338|nr:GlxA family transcriptional regulator [Pseudomonas sp. M47T1]EIK95389.1 AraC family transcriptional regulator [Pseudomonas sp. M47T1]
MKRIAIVLYPDFLLLDMAGPVEVFSIANRYLADCHRYEIATYATAQHSVRASNGITVHTDHLITDATAGIDLLLVPGGPGAYNARHPELVNWLAATARHLPCYGSICTGAFILGHAGLLDEHRVTTHWHYTERLIKAFPKAVVGTEDIYIHDRKLLSSGGVTAGIDLALSIVAQDHGRKVALDVAKVLLVIMRRQGDQAQFSPLVAEVAAQDSPVTRVQHYILDHLDQPLTLQALAEVAAMSPRHLSRVFARDVQMTPMAFIQNARIDRARHLLESTELPFKTVAFKSGFGSVRHMRLLFSERLGRTPAQYREQFL